MFNKLLLALGLTALAFTALAADTSVPPKVDKAVRAAVVSLAPGVQVESVSPSPLPGFYQVIASGQLVYVSANGKYLMNGDLIDVPARKNLSDPVWAAFRKKLLATVPAAQRIVFAPPAPKATLVVFTDVNCPYCRALDEQVPALNKAGIAVDYLAWPREGLVTTAGRPTHTYTEMVSVWCATDREAAFTRANQSHAPKPATCANPVKQQFELGRRLNVTGTPTIITPGGQVIGGYLPADQIIAALRQEGSLGG